MNAIILAGGTGSRLWPLSTPKLPKQFLKIQTLSFYQQALVRAHAVAETIVVVTTPEYGNIAYDQASEINVPIHITDEPCARGTAPAIFLGCIELEKCDQENLSVRGSKPRNVVIMPSDHLIRNSELFCQKIEKIGTMDMGKTLVALSVLPSDGMDYSQYGNMRSFKESTSSSLVSVISFHEKPEPGELAKILSENWYDHRINAGIFISTPQSIISFFQNSLDWKNRSISSNDGYRALPMLSFDREVVSHYDRLYTVDISDCGWSDIGSWDVLKKELRLEVENYFDKWKLRIETLDREYEYYRKIQEPDAELRLSVSENESENKRELHFNYYSMVQEPYGDLQFPLERGRKMTIQPESKKESQEMKKRVWGRSPYDCERDGELYLADMSSIKTMQPEPKEELEQIYKREERPWGWFKVLHEESRKKIKLLCVNPGEQTSLQSHEHRDETWVCLSGFGDAQVVISHVPEDMEKDYFWRFHLEAEKSLLCDDKIQVRKNQKHRLINTGDEPLHVLEIQTGDYLGEDDIVRYEDKYGRIS